MVKTKTILTRTSISIIIGFSVTMLTIPEIAVAEVEKSTLQGDDDNDDSRSIFLTGSKSVGKSTALQGFLDKTDKVRETLVLEYSYGRKSKQKQSVDKMICHIWEYGGNLELLKETMGCVPRQGRLTVVMMVDLSHPRRLWLTLEVCLQAVDQLLNGPNKAPVTVVIVGGKYDVYKNFDSETKKNVNITTRSLALIYNAYVVFYSCEDQSLAKRMKQIFHFFGFGSGSFPKDKVVSINKPLCIPQGTDSWDSIGVAQSSFDQVKFRHLSVFASELEDLVPPIPEGIPLSHSEPVIDSIKKKTYDEMIEVVDGTIIEYVKSLQ